MLNKIINILYPNVCGICGKLSKESLCLKCYNKLKLQINLEIDIYKDKHFNKHIYYSKYDGIIRKKVLDYKFYDSSYLYKLFSEIILKNKKTYILLKFYDIIIPVPLSGKKRKLRGYNQTELIAREIAKELGISLNTNILLKIRDNKMQSSLKKEERLKNVKDAYLLKNIECIKNKRILLLDDVYTTGATVNECSRILKNAGALNIDVLTISKD